MKKRIIRLTEKDLTNLVKRVINESKVFATNPAHNTDGGENWYDSANDERVSDPENYDEERSFGVGEYEDFRNFIEGCQERWCLNVKEWFDRYAEIGPIKVRKRGEDNGDEHSEILDYKALQRMRDKFKK